MTRFEHEAMEKEDKSLSLSLSPPPPLLSSCPISVPFCVVTYVPSHRFIPAYSMLHIEAHYESQVVVKITLLTLNAVVSSSLLVTSDLLVKVYSKLTKIIPHVWHFHVTLLRSSGLVNT